MIVPQKLEKSSKWKFVKFFVDRFFNFVSFKMLFCFEGSYSGKQQRAQQERRKVKEQVDFQSTTRCFRNEILNSLRLQKFLLSLDGLPAPAELDRSWIGQRMPDVREGPLIILKVCKEYIFQVVAIFELAIVYRVGTVKCLLCLKSYHQHGLNRIPITVMIGSNSSPP